MGMEERTLELTVISAQNLKNVKKSGQQACYAVAYIRSREKKASRVDKDGGLNPTWNAKLILNCDEKLLQRGGKYITVEIYSHGTFRNKLVGTSRISLLEIGKQVAAAAPPKLLSFDVLRPSGMVRGVLNVSVKALQRNRSATLHRNYTGKAPFSAFSDNYKRQQLQESAVPMGYPHAYPPRSPIYSKVETIAPYRPPKSYTTSSSSKMESELVIAYDPASGYPAPQQYGRQFDKSQYYGSQYVGPQRSYYSSSQAPRSYEEDQEIHYSKSSRRQCCTSGRNKSSGMGIGLAGGVLAGILVGDMIGDVI